MGWGSVQRGLLGLKKAVQAIKKRVAQWLQGAVHGTGDSLSTCVRTTGCTSS